MTVEDLEDEYSEEESDSYESDDEENLNPWGGTRKTYENGELTFRKKERIQRRGRVPLNMTRNYGRKSGWGVREGIRELIQNLYVSHEEG